MEAILKNLPQIKNGPKAHSKNLCSINRLIIKFNNERSSSEFVYSPNKSERYINFDHYNLSVKNQFCILPVNNLLDYRSISGS